MLSSTLRILGSVVVLSGVIVGCGSEDVPSTSVPVADAGATDPYAANPYGDTYDNPEYPTDGDGGAADAGEGEGGAIPSCDPDDLGTNNVQAQAEGLTAVGDNDHSADAIPQTVGTLENAEDVDWYVFSGRDELFNYVDPSVAFSGSNASVCVYLRAPDGVFKQCPAGTTADSSEQGDPGCCSNGSVTFSNSDLSAGLGDQSMAVYIKIAAAEGSDAECSGYNFTYHF